MEPARLRFLQGLISSPGDRRISNVATQCCEEYRIGTRTGQRYVYGAADIESACALLRSYKLPLSTAELLDRADASIRPGVSEKYGTTAPHQNSVAFRLFRKTQSTFTGYGVATSDEVNAIDSDVMVVVENFETFRQLHRYQWVIDRLDKFPQSLVVFRGDLTYSIADASRTISASGLPKIGFHDFDPAGLAMSSALSGLIEHLLPPFIHLQDAVLRGNRSDLYFAQIAQYASTLDKSTSANIPEAWGLMRQLQRGLPQEWMRDLVLSKPN